MFNDINLWIVAFLILLMVVTVGTMKYLRYSYVKLIFDFPNDEDFNRVRRGFIFRRTAATLPYVYGLIWIGFFIHNWKNAFLAITIITGVSVLFIVADAMLEVINGRTNTS